MQLKILLVTATDSEADACKKSRRLRIIHNGFSAGRCDVTILVSGVGAIATAWAMTKWISANERPDLAINAGIAGSYRDEINIGDVVMPVSDLFADAGIETDSGFLTLGESGLGDNNRFPFKDGRIVAENEFVDRAKKILRPVNAITVNTVTGTSFTAEKLRLKFNPDIETMEGAAFFYICSRERIPFIAIRSISNKVEPRNRGSWEIDTALNKLSEKLEEYLLNPD